MSGLRCISKAPWTGKKIANGACDFVAMRFEREVAGIQKLHFGVRDVAFEGLRTRRQEEWVVLAPHGQKRRLVFAEVTLEFWIERDVGLVVAEKIELNFIRTGARQIITVERISVRRNQARIANAVRILPDGSFGREKGAERLAIRVRSLRPISPDRVPAFAQ